jgi:hypothetical protein
VGRLPTALLIMSTTEKKNILITGACGFIASHVCRDLVRKSPPSSLDLNTFHARGPPAAASAKSKSSMQTRTPTAFDRFTHAVDAPQRPRRSTTTQTTLSSTVSSGKPPSQTNMLHDPTTTRNPSLALALTPDVCSRHPRQVRHEEQCVGPRRQAQLLLLPGRHHQSRSRTTPSPLHSPTTMRFGRPESSPLTLTVPSIICRSLT